MIKPPNRIELEVAMGGRGRRYGRWLLAVCVGLLSVIMGAAPAFAHNSFTGSNPEDGATLDRAPEEIELRFLAKLDPAKTDISVKSPDGESAMEGEPRFDGKKVFAAFVPGVAGDYVAEYSITSSDGHPIKGKITFTLSERAAGASPSASVGVPSPSAVVSSEAVPATDAPVLTPTAGSGGDDGGAPWWPWAVGGVLLVIAVTGGTIAFGWRRAS